MLIFSQYLGVPPQNAYQLVQIMKFLWTQLHTFAQTLNQQSLTLRAILYSRVYRVIKE